MTRIHPAARAAAVVVAGLLVSMAGSAKAQMPACSSLPNPVYLGGSSAVKPILAKLAPIFNAQGITIVYQGPASCQGITDLTGKTKEMAAANFWDPNAATPFASAACDIGSGINLDVGLSDVYATTCDSAGLPTGFKDFLGPIQVMTIVVPVGSTEESISAEAARVVFGFGADTAPHTVAPWTVNDDMHFRSNTSGTKNMIARAINLPVASWKGKAESGSGAVLTAVSTATSANTTLGILAADLGDQNRNTIKILAFQAKDQECGYYPDSSKTNFDKINVRQGRYDIWGPIHVITNVDGSGNPVPATGNTGDVAKVVSYFTHAGLSAADDLTTIKAEADAFTVPMCAMQVSRTTEVGPMSSFQPAKACGCFYESHKNGDQAAEGCKVCTSNADCTSSSAHSCNYGYCEAQ